jgi:hypothetical protein
MINLVPLIFQKKLFVFLFLGFVIATVVGTLSHECGHYFMARHLGFKKARIHYRSMEAVYLTDSEKAITIKYNHEIRNHLWFPLRPQYEKIRWTTYKEDLLIIAAGPVETILTGTIGLLLLFVYRKRYKQGPLLVWQWITVFLALFWLREPINLSIVIFTRVTRGHTQFWGDEFWFSWLSMGGNQWLLMVPLGIIGAIICAVVTFRFVPLQQRFTFILAGLAGDATGAILWFILLGPRLMP